MRDLKFRAWHKEEKKMCVVDLLNIKEGAFLIGVKCGKDSWIGDRTISIAPKDGRFCDWVEIELMEFTGLKDKNGKEIYEGDIVNGLEGIWNEYAEENINTAFKSEVKFVRSAFCIMMDGSWREMPHHQEEKEFIEVIGNIYENPELLTK